MFTCEKVSSKMIVSTHPMALSKPRCMRKQRRVMAQSPPIMDLLDTVTAISCWVRMGTERTRNLTARRVIWPPKDILNRDKYTKSMTTTTILLISIPTFKMPTPKEQGRATTTVTSIPLRNCKGNSSSNMMGPTYLPLTPTKHG